MRGKRREIELREIERNLAGGLRDIAVEQHAPLACDRCELADVLQRPDLAVRRFDRDESCVWTHRVAQRIGRDESLAIRLQDRHLGNAFRRREDRSMLDRARDQMLAVFHLMQRDVVRLRRAGGEDDLVRLRVEKSRDGDARIFDGARCFPSMRVRERRGIAEVFGEVRQHRFDDPRIARRGGVMIEVDRRLRHETMIAPEDSESAIGDRNA